MGTTIKLLPTLGDSAASTREGEEALDAARSGCEYAQTRLQENSTWKGGGLAATVVSTPRLTVIEDQGNVFGFVKSPEGRVSQFRIRFNYQNGNGVAGVGVPDDGLPDPGTNHWIDTLFVSQNNLMGSTPSPVYRASSGTHWPVNGTSAIAYSAPPFGCCLTVEGRAGDSLRDTTPTNPDPASGNRRLVRRLVECTLSRPNQGHPDSAIYSAAPTTMDVGSGDVILDSGTDGAAKMRSLDSSTVRGNFLSSGTVVVDSNFNVSGGTPGSTSYTVVHENRTAQEANWLKIKWNDLRKAGASDTNIRAGTYVWRGDPPVLNYYAEEYTGGPLTTSPTVIASGGDMVVGGGPTSGPVTAVNVISDSMLTLFSGNVYVAPQGSVRGFTVLRENDDYSQGRPSVAFATRTLGSVPVLTGTGNVTVKGSVLGNGSVTAEGDITFQGSTLLETDTGTGVALYAKQDINMLAIPAPVATKVQEVLDSPISTSIDVITPDTTGVPYNALAAIVDQTNGTGTGYGPFKYPDPPAAINVRLDPISGGTPRTDNTGNDVVFKGVLFALKNFNADLGTGGNFFMRGILSAYGGDPDGPNNKPGTDGTGGKVDLHGRGIHLTYDPSYLNETQALPRPGQLQISFWTQHQ